MVVEDESINLDLSTIRNNDNDKNNNNLFEFNPNDFTNEISVAYPSLTSVLNQDKSVIGTTRYENDNFQFKFDENIPNMNNFNNDNNNRNDNFNFDFNKEDFNFDK